MSTAPDTLHPQFITDADGARVAVVLPLAEYETLLEDIEDLRDALAAREEPAEPWEAVKARLGLE